MKRHKELLIWRSMLNRCYSEKEQERKPTYIGCQVSENFKNYSYFYEWCQNQVGFGQKGWDLDKDLLTKGNKLYSEDLCVFLPHEINTFLTIRHRFRGCYPLGVDKRKDNGRFRVRININGKTTCIGHFGDEISAFQAYKKAKEENAKNIAAKWKGIIDDRAYLALMGYSVSISD